MQSAQLLEALKARGLVEAGVHQGDGISAAVLGSAAPAHRRPWFIAALLGVCGWIAGLFLLAFVWIAFSMNGAAMAGVVGGVLLAAACGLFLIDRNGASAASLFVGQLGLVLSIAGQCLVVYSLAGTSRSIAAIAGAALLLQLVLTLVVPNRLHRTLSTLFATIAWAVLVRFSLFGASPFPPLGLALAGFGLVWLPVGALLWVLLRSEPQWMARGRQDVLRPVTHGLIIGLATATLASEPFMVLSLLFGAGGQQGGLALWPLLSVLGALMATVAAFALRNKALVGIGAAFALLHLAYFYYELGTSLLLKALLMVLMGAACLLAARWLSPPRQEQERLE